MISLHIDTAKMDEVIVGLMINQEKTQLSKNHEKGSQIVLAMIEEILQKNNLSLFDINQIFVNQGPGSYTGLRVGISIANALAFALHVQINALPLGQFVEPKYE